MFPVHRYRRLRYNKAIRQLVRETRLSPSDLVLPLFVLKAEGIKKEIPSMPGCFQMSISEATKQAKEAYSLGVPAIILFGIPQSKDEKASDAYDEAGVVQTATQAIKDAVPEIAVITDVCLCEYTSHGHCGIVKNAEVLNDPTLELLSATAVSHAKAGADMVAPSDMMDGRVSAIRKALDAEGFEHIPIMAYSAKYASAFYGPFREAAESAPKFGDRRSYQMDFANKKEAMKEIAEDIEEGADIVMIKPALSYLDIIAEAKARFDVPVAAYNVSGEYSMVKAVGRLGWMDEQALMMEILTSIKRAGADIIITYFATDVASLL